MIFRILYPYISIVIHLNDCASILDNIADNTSCSHYFFRQRVTHDCASILDNIAKNTSCSHYFSHGGSLHQYSFSWMIFALVYAMYTCIYRCIHVHCTCWALHLPVWVVSTATGVQVIPALSQSILISRAHRIPHCYWTTTSWKLISSVCMQKICKKTAINTCTCTCI